MIESLILERSHPQQFLEAEITSFLQAEYLYIRTTNLLKRLNREIKRRADVVQIFPNEQACERLAGRRYLDMTHLKQNH